MFWITIFESLIFLTGDQKYLTIKDEVGDHQTLLLIKGVTTYTNYN